jgi:hypothetical protein
MMPTGKSELGGETRPGVVVIARTPLSDICGHSGMPRNGGPGTHEYGPSSYYRGPAFVGSGFAGMARAPE